MAEDKKDTAAAPTPARLAVDYDKLADSYRSRLDVLGKALAALATLGTTTVGLATVTNLATADDAHHHGLSGASGVAIGCLLIAGCSAVLIAIALMRVNQPVVLTVDPASASEYGPEVQADVAAIYTGVATQNGFGTLSALQLQARDYRIAARIAPDEEERKRRTELADEGQAEVDQALARARWAVVRRKASRAAGGWLSQLAYLGVLAGLLGFAFFSDLATDPETDDVALAKSCAEARSAGALEPNLKDTICEVPKDASSPTSTAPTLPNAAEQRAALSSALVKVLADCATMVPTTVPSPDRAVTDDDCAAIAALASRIYPSGSPTSGP